MRKTPQALLRDVYLAKFEDVTTPDFGVEVEMPLINLSGAPVDRAFAHALMECARDRLGFVPTARTADGIICNAELPLGDALSFDTTINTVEFSLRHELSIVPMAERFYRYMGVLQPFCEAHGHRIVGRGINPNALTADPSPLKLPSVLAKAEYLRTRTFHGDGTVFHSYSASTQTHLKPPTGALPEWLTLFWRLDFAAAYLFANSPALPEQLISHIASLRDSGDVLCFRDLLWRYCGAPNTEFVDRPFRSMDDVQRHLMKLKLFVVPDGEGGFLHMEPTPFDEYFSRDAVDPSDIQYFRPLEAVSVSRFGTIEIRSTCTQPLDQVFAPVAFYVGLSARAAQAKALLDAFIDDNGISLKSSEMRAYAIRGQYFAGKDETHAFLRSLMDVARQGLIGRGAGEEQYLPDLSTTGEITNPATRELRR